MITTIEYGRLGNQIIRNLAVSLIAEKHDLKVNYSNKDKIAKLGIELFSGSNVYETPEYLKDSNYFSILQSNSINLSLNPIHSFFQTKEITNFIYNYLHSESIKSRIIEKNPFKERYNMNNDLYIHVRLTDVEHFNPGIKYYLNTIQSIHYDKLYISTDDKDHAIIKKLFEVYPSAKLIKYDEIKTFQFASTCKNILLSHGSFSAVIGYLSFFSNIYYPEYESDKMWYGDMFSIKNWIKIKIK